MFTIDPEFQSLLTPSTPAELVLLEASIAEEGCRDPVIVWDETGILLDGHQRVGICDRLGKPYRETRLSLPDRLAAKIWVSKNQLQRRNLTDDQRAMVEATLTDLEIERAKQERAKAGRAAGGKATPEQIADRLGDNVSPERSESKPRAREAAAKRSGLPERKIRQAISLKRNAPELAARVQSGEMPLAAAVRETKRAEVVQRLESIETKTAKAAVGVYDVVVVDPPWPMAKIERDCRPNQQAELDYPTMDLAEIEAIKIPAAPDAHVFLWTTQRFLPDAFSILAAWAVKYVLIFVWHKPGGPQPFGLPQYNCEFCLYGRRGTPQFIDTKAFPTCFQAPRAEHSAKPEAFYETLRRVTAGRRIDMFNRRPIEGFDVWGKES
jgi:N6-adenosine-specific RNA methylase IME4